MKQTRGGDIVDFSVLGFFNCGPTCSVAGSHCRGTDKSLARPGRKQATATEDFDFHISHL